MVNVSFFGNSSEKGFLIGEGKNIIESKEWGSYDKINVLKYIFYPFIIYFFLIELLDVVESKNFIIRLIVAFGFTCFSVIMMIKRRFKILEEESNEWHAAEHKIVNLLEIVLYMKDISFLSMKNLKKTPMENINCGVNNINLKEPSREKLQEAMSVGQRYLDSIRGDLIRWGFN